MDEQTPIQLQRKNSALIGSSILIFGLLSAAELILKTGWLWLLLPALLGFILVIFGNQRNDVFFVLPGIFFVFSAMITIMIVLNDDLQNVFMVLGLAFIGAAISFFSYFLLRYFTGRYLHFWAVVPAITLLSIGMSFIFSDRQFLDYIFFIGIGIGLSLLSAGLFWRLFGLIIPGCLLLGISPGLYSAWEKPILENPLAQTGVMLVWFALGWGLITIFSRVLTNKFVWWPLIPGGILAMVGWGLYIGGNPSSAVGFIGNTGSIGLIIFGIYILLMKRSMHR